MPRYRDWQSRLQTVLNERRMAPFAWGTNDCCTFAADCVLAITGHDPAEGLRAHQTLEEATAVIAENGGVIALADARLGERVRPALAFVGDVGLVDTPNGPGFVICNGETWLGPGAERMHTIPHSEVKMAWRIA
jgi:hypothetical protein